MDSVGDEHLAAIDDVAITLASGRRLYVRDIRTTRRLAYAQSHDLVPFDRRRQPSAPLPIAAKIADRRRGDCDMGADAGSYTSGTAAGQLLEEHGFIDRPGLGSAELFRILEAKQVERGKTLEELARKLTVCLPLVDVGANFSIDELSNGGPKLLVLGGEEVRPRRGYVCQ
jgi:hypothetical protein